MKRIVLAACLLLIGHAAVASGPGLTTPWSIDPYGGSPAEQDDFYQGNVGILLAKAPWARLFAAWRMLHGLPVGKEAGASLALPCCGGEPDSADASMKAWLAARSVVPNATKISDYAFSVFRSVGDFQVRPDLLPGCVCDGDPHAERPRCRARRRRCLGQGLARRAGCGLRGVQRQGGDAGPRPAGTRLAEG